MNRSDFQQLLKEDLSAPSEDLPANFADKVLLRGKRFRHLLEQHWKRLTIASALSLAIAIAMAIGISAMFPDPDPAVPPLLLFHGGAETTPFSTK